MAHLTWGEGLREPTQRALDTAAAAPHLFFLCIILPYDPLKSDAPQATPFAEISLFRFVLKFWMGMFLLFAIKPENINCHCQVVNFSWM